MSTKTAPESTPDVGYPRIERLLDTEEFEPVNQTFAKSYEELEKVARQKAGLGKAKQAKKCMRAFELTTELFKELLKLKYQMVEAGQQAGKKK